MHSTDYEHTLSRLQRLALPSHLESSLTSPALFSATPCSGLSSHKVRYSPPFSHSYFKPNDAYEDNAQIIIDTFAPRPVPLDFSPTSSASSDLDSTSSHSSASKSSFEAFFATRSRVVRLYNLPALAASFLSAVFRPQGALDHSLGPIPIPTTMWELREEYNDARSDSVWAVFRTHEEACAALSLCGPAMSVATALEGDLEPFHKLKAFVLKSIPPTSSPSTLSSHPPLDHSRSQMLRTSSSYPDLHTGHSFEDTVDYTISSNPPNPKTSFRLGDWICNSPKCAAHNFGRNLSCIGCGCPRSANSNSSAQQFANPTNPRAAPSPRFNSQPSSNVTYYSSSLPPHQPSPQPSYISHPQQSHSPRYSVSPVQPHASQPPKSSHPLLTPSGRAFAVGGKVQNISSDPLSPCIMYWPDNEPFPEQGQIRPSGLVGVPQPPILNTGNRGPISHQPGDWICQKCNYLNWRRRKVCQTCLPYAEGNGDSISAAVQAERIALLTSVLTQTQLSSGGLAPPSSAPHQQAAGSHSPPQARRQFADLSPPQARPVHRSQSHLQLGAQYSNTNAAPAYNAPSPIYQTSGHRERQPSPLYTTGPEVTYSSSSMDIPAPLLPSFLQDIVQSPALSPTSTTTSSADLSSIEEFEEPLPQRSMFPRARGSSGASDNSPISNIWRLDGEESKSLATFPLTTRQDVIGTRKDPREKLHVRVM